MDEHTSTSNPKPETLNPNQVLRAILASQALQIVFWVSAPSEFDMDLKIQSHGV